MNPETRNLVAAISLSMAVLIGYQLLFVEPKKDIAQKENIVKESDDSANIPIPQNFDNGIVASDNTEPKSSNKPCLLYTSPSPRDRTRSRMPSSA